MIPEFDVIGLIHSDVWDRAIYNRPRQNGKQAMLSHYTHRTIYADIGTNEESTVDRKDVITAEIARLQAELATRARFGEDHEDGTILSFDGHFAGNPHVYSYAAIRADGTWHLSGSQARSKMTWSQFVDFLASVNATNLRKRGKGKLIAE